MSEVARRTPNCVAPAQRGRPRRPRMDVSRPCPGSPNFVSVETRPDEHGVRPAHRGSGPSSDGAVKRPGRTADRRSGSHSIAGSYQHYGTIAGPFEEIPVDGVPYRVRYRSLLRRDHTSWVTWLLALAALATATLFALYLFRHVWAVTGGPVSTRIANNFVVFSVYLITAQALINTLSFDIASLVARDPVPVRPTGDLRVAFVTTIVPASEPVEIALRTLRAATRITYAGVCDVWLLDEGDDPALAEACAAMGVRHFSRFGNAAYNTRKGRFRARRKHGNLNSFIDAHGDDYDVIAGVDPDHVPQSSYLERMLGYFRDGDVAYVVGPQVYENVGVPIARAAESQQFPFHSVIQRAANRYGVPMLVGTSYAIRLRALRQVGGFQDSVTEDLLTGLAIHAARNPLTRRRWRSVYTPDVLAIGEGPSTAIDMANQQYRWSIGTINALLGEGWRKFLHLRPTAMLHYWLTLNFYPSMAIAWILGALNSCLYLTLGAVGIRVSPEIWVLLYGWSGFLQCWLYSHNRKHNISPFEAAGTHGVNGMLMTVFCGPIYATSLLHGILNAVTRRSGTFNVTGKGLLATDGAVAFRRHLFWAAITGTALVYAAIEHVTTPMVYLWPATIEVICLAPFVLWLTGRLTGEREHPVEAALMSTPVPEPQEVHP